MATPYSTITNNDNIHITSIQMTSHRALLYDVNPERIQFFFDSRISFARQKNNMTSGLVCQNDINY